MSESKPRKLTHHNRRLSAAERARHAEIRAAAERDYPAKRTAKNPPAPGSIPQQIRAAREARGLTWYALAKQAGIRHQATIRDLEKGKDVRLSNLERIAAALGLSLELVE